MISVIMGLHEYDEFVSVAIRSILSQSYKNFEFIIVANGSKNLEIAHKIESDFQSESRIKIVRTPIGQLSYALNLAVDAAQYEYLARMDGDDIAHPDRLQLQFSYMIDHDLDMVGCDLTLIDENDKIIGCREYPKSENINKLLKFKNCFAHNTVLYKKSVLIAARGYNSGFNSEDYDLWLRLGRGSIKWDNMNLKLVSYRIHSGASQRRLLGYAESSALALREFLLNKTVGNLGAVFYHIFKTFIRVKRK